MLVNRERFVSVRLFFIFFSRVAGWKQSALLCIDLRRLTLLILITCQSCSAVNSEDGEHVAWSHNWALETRIYTSWTIYSALRLRPCCRAGVNVLFNTGWSVFLVGNRHIKRFRQNSVLTVSCLNASSGPVVRRDGLGFWNWNDSVKVRWRHFPPFFFHLFLHRECVDVTCRIMCLHALSVCIHAQTHVFVCRFSHRGERLPADTISS